MTTFRETARIIRRVATAAVVVVVGVLTVALVAIALLPNLGVRSMVVTSGSMEPTIRTGGVAFVADVDPDDIVIGDIITFVGGSHGRLTTHRVIDLRTIENQLYFRTQGDANDTPDVDLASAEAVVGRVRFDLPYAGRVLGHVQHPFVRYLLVGGASAWMVITNAVGLGRALRRRRSGCETPVATTTTAVLLVVVLLATGAALRGVSTTVATLTDVVDVADNAFTTGTW